MKAVCLIPIKLNSERVPQKNIKKFFDGIPLMHFIQRVCLNTEAISDTYIYCSDENIKDYILPGVKFLKRPEYLDLDTSNSNTIIKEFIKAIDADIYIETHSTAPFATPESFNICIEKVACGGYDSAFCANRLQSFLWQNGKPLNFDPDNFPRTQDLQGIYEESSNAFVFTKDIFIRYGRRVGVRPYIHEIGKIESMDIDYPEDFEIANAIYKEIVKNEDTIA